MASSKFLQGSVTVSANTTKTIIEYKVSPAQTLFIQQVSIDLSPANYFPNITFSLEINGIADPNFSNINAQITQSYFPLSLPIPIKVDGGLLVEWKITGLASLGTNTATAYGSLLGEVR